MKLLNARGLTEVWSNKDKVMISHMGNMGNTVERSVRPNVENMYGPILDKLLEVGAASGSPDYSWTLTVTKKEFEEAVRDAMPV